MLVREMGIHSWDIKRRRARAAFANTAAWERRFSGWDRVEGDNLTTSDNGHANPNPRMAARRNVDVYETAGINFAR
jgi:hypothetical protein